MSALTRALIANTRSPLVKLFYWYVFLDLYLQSGIRSPVYTEDALPEMTALLNRTAPDLADLEFLADLRRVSESPLLPDTEMTREFRRAIAAIRHTRMASHDSTEPELHASVLLVPVGREFLGNKPELAIPAMLSVRANRGFRKPGEAVWRIERQENDPIESIANHALRAAQKEAGVKRAALSYEIRLQRADWHLRGSSLALALAVLFFVFEAAEKRKSPRTPASDVVILGSVDEGGKAIPVSETTLAYKIRAAFGAGFRAIVLPIENLEAARRELIRLSERFPETQVPVLVPVASLHEVLSDASLFVRPTKPVRSLVIRVRTPRVLAGIILGLIVLGGLF
ncbi:MAG: hypothetical protein ABIH26_05125, partial [Candidatus Eisenbacteria bacterium]